jgi:glycine/D-amino acid oxidase-like deaminating enzyme
MVKSGGIRFPSYAIVGGGFSGLAVANYLVNTNPDCVIDIFDSASLPGRQGASAIAVRFVFNLVLIWS